MALATAAPASAQLAVDSGSRITLSAAVGPSATQRGTVDTIGLHATAGIALHGRRGLGLRLEVTAHRYPAASLYPCLVQDAQYCYQTMRRSVVGTIASVTYHVSRAQVGSGEMAPYLIAGAGLYGSRRVATHYPECQPLGPCDRTTHTLQLRDRQFGASGGVGVDARVYGVPAFVELRVHYMYADTTAGEPSNDYFLIPLSVGLRFR